jgi:quercetin dioxygenase-like cupin family protein
MAAIGSGILSLLVSMAIAFGIESPLAYSVFTLCAARFLLAAIPAYSCSLDSYLFSNNVAKKRDSPALTKLLNHYLINYKTMTTTILTYITHSHQQEWKPLDEPDAQGIFVKVLRYDTLAGRAPSFLSKFEPGAKYPYHDHPAGEEIFVLEGSVIIEGTTLFPGDYLYTPPGFKHDVRTETGCILFFIVPEEVEIL